MVPSLLDHTVKSLHNKTRNRRGGDNTRKNKIYLLDNYTTKSLQNNF